MPALKTSNGVAPGATAAEIVNIASANVGETWTADGCVMLTYAVSNLAGLPFFNTGDYTINRNPLSVQNVALAVPHTYVPNKWTSDLSGDGWATVWTGTHADGLKAQLKAGDIVRVYHSGNPEESSGQANWAGTGSHYGGHSFIVEGWSGGTLMVIDNWTAGKVTRHNFDDIVTYYAPSGSFQSAFVSRIDTNWVASNLKSGLAGNSKADFTGIAPTASEPATSLSGTPDLTVINALVDDKTLFGGQMARVDFEIKNVGTGDSGASSAGLYLSKDVTWSTNDIRLATNSTTSLMRGASDTGEYNTLTIPTSTAAGSWHILVVADHAKVIAEADKGGEDNNVAAIPITINGTADLYSSKAKLDDDTAKRGQTLKLTWQTENKGDGEASPSDSFIFLSRDTVLSKDDFYLDHETLGRLAPGAKDSEFESFVIPDTVGTGKWFIILATDAGLDVPEFSEINNFAYVPLTIA